MTEDELKQFRELAKKYERGKDKDAVLKIFSEDIHEVYQDVNDKGHSAATAAKQKDVEALSGQLTSERARADEAERKLKGMQEAPDIATMRQTYEQNEKKLREEHDIKLNTQKTEFERQLQDKDKLLIETRLEVARGKLVDELAGSKLGIDKEYAETVLVAKPDINGRLKLQPDGKPGVLKKGSQDMFIVPAEGRTALEHFAEEIAESVEDKWKGSGQGRGSATTGSSGGNNATASRFDATRERVQKREKEAAAAKAGGSAHERLGGRR